MDGKIRGAKCQCVVTVLANMHRSHKIENVLLLLVKSWRRLANTSTTAWSESMRS
jgi:hypothetical protein